MATFSVMENVNITSKFADFTIVMIFGSSKVLVCMLRWLDKNYNEEDVIHELLWMAVIVYKCAMVYNYQWLS